jgi:pimeloyl-ACP methyl ester carboxylesterase
MRRFFGAVAVAAVLLGFVALSFQPTGAVAAPGDGDSGKGIVYLIRGGLNIFSTGMDEVAAKLRARGIDARTLGQATWRDAAREAAERYEESPEPIVFAGHSFGANAAVLAAEQLGNKEIPVALIILFDPTEVLKAPYNVERLLNYVSVDSLGYNVDVWSAPGFAGKVENILHPDVNHIQIDNDEAIQDKAVGEIVKAVGSGARAAAE